MTGWRGDRKGSGHPLGKQSVPIGTGAGSGFEPASKDDHHLGQPFPADRQSPGPYGLLDNGPGDFALLCSGDTTDLHEFVDRGPSWAAPTWFAIRFAELRFRRLGGTDSRWLSGADSSIGR